MAANDAPSRDELFALSEREASSQGVALTPPSPIAQEEWEKIENCDDLNIIEQKARESARLLVDCLMSGRDENAAGFYLSLTLTKLSPHFEIAFPCIAHELSRRNAFDYAYNAGRFIESLDEIWDISMIAVAMIKDLPYRDHLMAGLTMKMVRHISEPLCKIGEQYRHEREKAFADGTYLLNALLDDTEAVDPRDPRTRERVLRTFTNATPSGLQPSIFTYSQLFDASASWILDALHRRAALASATLRM